MMKKLFLSLMLLLPSLSAAQGFRFDAQITQQATIGTTTNAVVIPAAAQVAFCSFPANATPCTNKATTYTSQTLVTPCSTSTQIVLVGTTACVASPDAQENWGVWVPGGNYSYTVTLPGGTNLGPYNVTLGASLGANNAFTGNNTHSGTETFTGRLNCKNFGGTRCVDGSNSQGWAGAAFANWVDSAIADCGATSCIVQIAADSPAGNASVTYFVTQDGITTIQTPANVVLVDNRTSATAYANIMYNGVPSSDPAMLTVYNHLISPPHTSGALFTTSQVTGTTPADGGTVSSLTSEMDVNGTLTSVAGASKVVAVEGYAAIRSLGQTIADVRGGTFSVNLDRAPSTTNVTDASSLFASPCRNLSSTATIVNCYSFQAQQPTLGTSRNYSAFFNGSVLMPNNVNFDVVNSSGTAARFLTFNVDNTTAFRPRGTDQAGDFQFTDTTATIPIMTLGTSGGNVLAGVCINGPSYRWHVECATAGDIIAKFRNTSATGFGVVFTPGLDTNYGLAVTNAANSSTNFDILGNGAVRMKEVSAPSGTAGLDVCYGDSTAHALECSYNNGTFGVVPLLNRAQTWTAAQTHTGAAIIPDQTSGITGTTTNNNVNAGGVGEYVQSVLATGSSVTLATGVTSNVTSISLTAGDWDVTGAVDFTFGATTSYTNLIGSVSTTTGTIGGQDSKFDFETPAAVPTAASDATFPLPVVRFSLASTTTVFLVAQGTFTVSTLKAYGTIRARRIR